MWVQDIILSIKINAINVIMEVRHKKSERWGDQ
jgi:hypothetical protein